MKKILGIVGSPRKKGNTSILVAEILEGAKELGAQVDTIFLDDYKIKECTGCLACWKGKKCPRNDDMLNLYPKIIESDAFVFGTPVYWYGPTALMKAFIDRFVYFNCPENRTKVRGKPCAIAIPFEEEDITTGEFVAQFFEKCFQYLEMPLAGKILAPGAADKGDVLKMPESLDASFNLGKKLAGAQ